MGVRTRWWGAVCAGVYVMASAAVANGATIAVPAGGNLQAAINAAQPGDVITLAPGATYVGNFVLPNKGALTDFITLRSAAPDSALPPAGIRLTPAYAAKLPKIRSANSMSALRTAAAANHWRLLFLEFQANLNGYGDIVALGAGDSSQTQLSQVPYALILDRVYIHGDPVLGQKRGLSLNSRDTTVINSYISECKAIGQDTQAIGGFNGPGNYLIENNYLEGATENVLFGGADPTIPNLVTTNVTFRRNHLRKPLSWRDPIIAMPASPAAHAVAGGGMLAAGTYSYKITARASAGQTNKATSSPTAAVTATIAAGTTGGVTISWTPVVGAEEYLVYGRTPGAENVYWKTTTPYFTDIGATGTPGTPSNSGTKWAVKNIFELKNAQDVIVEGNVFENLWVADQAGYPIVFTPRNQGGHAPWAVVQRITFEHNLVRHTAGGVNILGTDNLAPSQRTNHVIVRDNVFDDLTASTWGTGSRPFIIGNGPDAVTIDHNTVVTTDTAFIWVYGGTVTAPTAATNTVVTNNMTTHNAYGIMGSGIAFGAATIAAYLPGSVISRNVLAGGSASKYPTGNFFPTVPVWQAGFVAFAAGDYHLTPSSPYRAVATDGGDLGATIDTINAQTAIALSGNNTMAPGVNPVRITQTTLPDGVLNQSYAERLVCTGGSGPCAWQLHTSTMPAGLAFDSVAALVSGTPSQVQTGQLVVEAFDPSWPTNSTTTTLSITINPLPFVVTIPAAPAAQVGTLYQLTPSVSGAIGSPTWWIASGNLPPGVTLDSSSGMIRGVPESWSTFTALVQAQDSWGTNRTDAKPVTVIVAPAPLSIDASSLAHATYRTPYSGSLSAHGGTGQTSWSIVSGTLPEGLTLAPTGSISGTPTAIGAFTATIQARDVQWPGNVATLSVVLTVDPPPVPVAAPPSSTPFGGTAAAIPGVIEAENFDAGGEGIAYHDLSPGNVGGQYRQTDVDIATALDTGGGYILGYAVSGEWLKYSVSVAASGSYTLEARVASAGSGGIFHVEVDGVDATGPLTVLNTGDWQRWLTISRSGILLTAGPHVLRLVLDTNGGAGWWGNLNYMRWTVGGTPPPNSTPFGGTAAPIPGVIEAENFDAGGEGIAYHDLSSGNVGGQYRQTDVDIATALDAGGGYTLGYAVSGEWLKYSVSVAASDSYTLEARVASSGSGGTFHVEVDGIDATGPLTVPNTGGWQTWVTISRSGIPLTAGPHVLRLVLDTNGATGWWGNLNYLRWKRPS